VCASYGKDTCSINHQDVRKGDSFYIGVRCFETCSYTIMPFLTDEFMLDDGVQMALDFQAQESKVFKFYIPPASEREQKLNSVTITAAPFKGGTHDILLSVSAVPNEMPTSGSIKGVPGWKKGQVVRLEQEEGFCQDCNITILVDVQEAGKYHVMAKSNYGVEIVREDQKLDDMVLWNERICYKYYVKNSEAEVLITTATFSGQVLLYANPQKIPETGEEAAFGANGGHDVVLAISPAERRTQRHPIGNYYICVQGELTSTYTLVVREVKEGDPTFLEDGYVETHQLAGGKRQLYMYKVPPLDYTEEDFWVTFSLTSMQGPLPMMAGKACTVKDPLECAKGVKDQDISESRNGFIRGKQVGTLRELQIDHKEDECQREFKGNCYYLIGVINEDSENAQFTFAATHTQNNHKPIQENRPYPDSVGIQKYKYYSFYMGGDDNANEINFEMTGLHGDADIFISKSMQFPTQGNCERSSQKIGVLSDSIVYKKDEDHLEGTYYIAIYGYSFSTYNLIAKVDRGDRQDPLNPVLYEGLPQRGKLHNEFDSDVYQFTVDLEEDRDIIIQATPFEGSINLLVSWETVPTALSF